MELRYHKPLGVAKTKFILIKKFKNKRNHLFHHSHLIPIHRNLLRKESTGHWVQRARGSGIAEALSQACPSLSSFPWPAFPQALLMLLAPHYPLSWATGSPRTMALSFPTSQYKYNTKWATSSIHIAMETSLSSLFLTRKCRPKQVE